MTCHTAIFPGTFDPITNGHIDLIQRSAAMFEKVIVAVAQNDLKRPRFDIGTRIQFASQALSHLSNVTVEGFSNLLVDYARTIGVRMIIRGLRAVTDFEYELQLAKMNKELNPEIETLFLTAGEQYSFISASLICEIAQLNGDVNAFVPSHVAKALVEKYQKRS